MLKMMPRRAVMQLRLDLLCTFVSLGLYKVVFLAIVSQSIVLPTKYQPAGCPFPAPL
jgi:hypothetical protein